MATKKKIATKVKVNLRKLKVTVTATDQCSKACLILKHTHESSQALLRAYRLLRLIRGIDASGKKPLITVRGMSTDEEQDLLRSMLVTAAAGLDAMTKQLIRDTLLRLIEIDIEALSGLEKFVRQRLKGDLEEDSGKGVSFLARILVAPSIQQQIIEDYISHLTAGSLQSAEELAKIAASLGLKKEHVHIDHKALKPVFDVRNKIIHELDVNLDAPRRNRNVRNEPTMRKHTNILLGLAEGILDAVDKKLNTATKQPAR